MCGLFPCIHLSGAFFLKKGSQDEGWRPYLFPCSGSLHYTVVTCLQEPPKFYHKVVLNAVFAQTFL